MNAERRAAIAELRKAYLDGELGAVCDAILGDAATLLGPREPLVDPLMLDAGELRAIARSVPSNPDAWVVGCCRGCGDAVARARRGAPRLRCDACSGREQVAS